MSNTNFGRMGMTEPQADILNSARRFCAEQSPMSRVRALMETPLGFDVDIWAQTGALGWLGIAIPEEYGGLGLSMTEVVPVAEQMGRTLMASPFAATTLAAQAILSCGTETQKKSILPQIAGGAAATLALYEDGGDWDLTAISARATRKTGGDGFTLTGEKYFASDLMAAKFVVLSAFLEGAPALFVIETAAIAQANIRREKICDETRRTYALNLSGINVTDAALMDCAKTPTALALIDMGGALLAAADMTGACQACIDSTAEYMKTRKQFGKYIGSFQGLKHPLVSAFVNYQNARSLLYAAAYSFDAGRSGEISVRMAKARAGDALSFAADRSIQFHGGFGFTWGCDAQLYRRRAMFQTAQFGDSRMQRQRLADLLL